MSLVPARFAPQRTELRIHFTPTAEVASAAPGEYRVLHGPDPDAVPSLHSLVSAGLPAGTPEQAVPSFVWDFRISNASMYDCYSSYLDFTPDGVVNSDDLGDFITAYFAPIPEPGPGGYAAPCPMNPPPYHAGYKVKFTIDGSVQCFPPNSDNLGDYITAYFTGC